MIIQLCKLTTGTFGQRQRVIGINESKSTSTVNSQITGTTIFTVMSGLATKAKAINLGQGFPDFPMNAELVELVAKAMRDGYNQYAPMPGDPPFLQTIAEKIESLYGMRFIPKLKSPLRPAAHMQYILH